MKKSELRQIIKEEIQKLNEYFIRSGDSIESLLLFNVFNDIIEYPVNNPEIYDDGEDLTKLNKIVKKYTPTVKALQKVILKRKKEKIPQDLVDKADSMVYDGSDAYDSPRDVISYLVKIWDNQIEFVKDLLDEV